MNGYQNDLGRVAEGLLASAVFRGVLDKPLFAHFLGFCSPARTREERLADYGKFVAEIYDAGGDLADAVRRIVFENENVYVVTCANGNAVPSPIRDSAARELALLSDFAALTAADFAAALENSTERDAKSTELLLPHYVAERVDLAAEYEARLCEIGKHGYGIFASHGMFRLDAAGEILPVESADPITMEQFVGYESERAQVLANTMALLEGRPAANALLCGDAGTGKSSTVKAVANYLFDEGLRLIEVRKDQLFHLPRIMGRIRHNPLKFILFIDDLSFDRNDDCFGMLKAILEGSASAKAPNAVIYATSNRRHMVRETFGDREGGDVHRNDSMQETMSLSERFGLVVRFYRPEKKLYLDIVHELAARHGITRDRELLDVEAEAFALRRGYRSARCAEQFIKSLL
ncbi:MAG: ATP-binding protein [Clostridia bacterium]|nr:ATP-binding protein [Clostridia bacterium]